MLMRNHPTYPSLKPCCHGHVPVRFLMSGACVECSQGRSAAARAKTAERKRLRAEAKARLDHREALIKAGLL